jgi:hypothetical protein
MAQKHSKTDILSQKCLKNTPKTLKNTQKYPKMAQKHPKISQKYPKMAQKAMMRGPRPWESIRSGSKSPKSDQKMGFL